MGLDFKMAWAHHVCRSVCYLPIAAEAGLFQELDGFADTAELGTIVIARSMAEMRVTLSPRLGGALVRTRRR
jgi:hypothetical protein